MVLYSLSPVLRVQTGQLQLSEVAVGENMEGFGCLEENIDFVHVSGWALDPAPELLLVGAEQTRGVIV